MAIATASCTLHRRTAANAPAVMTECRAADRRSLSRSTCHGCPPPSRIIVAGLMGESLSPLLSKPPPTVFCGVHGAGSATGGVAAYCGGPPLARPLMGDRDAPPSLDDEPSWREPGVAASPTADGAP